jgi:hypothetical protein
MQISRRAPRHDAIEADDKASRTTQTFPAPTPDADAGRPALRTQPRLEPIESPMPTRSREAFRAARQTSTAEEPRAKSNTVQIGKIEVQIVPPPASSYRTPPPAPPKARLARGYGLWPGW